MKTTAWTAPDARRWWQWLGPWPLLPLVDGLLASVLALSVRSSLLRSSNVVPEILLAILYGVVVGGIIYASRRWLTRFAESGLGYFTTITVAVTASTALRFAQGRVLDYPAQPPWSDFAIAASRSLISIVILQAIVGALHTRLQQQVFSTTEARKLVERQAEALLEADEAVRGSVAGLLHDRVQGGLLAACLRLQRALDQPTLSGEEIRRVISDLERLRSLDVRRAVRALSPSLRDVDLETALHDLVDPYEPSVDVEMVIEHPLGVTSDCALAAYRIIEQSLLNAVDHGRATSIRIAVHRERDRLTITVEDNGAGLPTAFTPGFGTTLIDTWCRTRMGTWSLAERDSGGAVVRASLPASSDHDTLPA